MYFNGLLLICSQTVFFEDVFGQCLVSYASPAPIYGSAGFTRYNYPVYESYQTGLSGGIGFEAYGGVGEGNIGVAGALPVTGITAIAGKIPIMGAVKFCGDVPAAGIVTITGNCGCDCVGTNYIL